MIDDFLRRLANTGGMQKDPVCGMKVDPKKTMIHSVYNKRHCLFCSEECKKMFDADPGKYVF